MYPPWLSDEAEPNAEVWAKPDETTADIVSWYRTTRRLADETINGLGCNAVGRVPWWGVSPVTLHQVLVHVTSETQRHAGTPTSFASSSTVQLVFLTDTTICTSPNEPSSVSSAIGSKQREESFEPGEGGSTLNEGPHRPSAAGSAAVSSMDGSMTSSSSVPDS